MHIGPLNTPVDNTFYAKNLIWCNYCKTTNLHQGKAWLSFYNRKGNEISLLVSNDKVLPLFITTLEYEMEIETSEDNENLGDYFFEYKLFYYHA